MTATSAYFTSLGSVGEVGASAHLIEIGGLSLLLDSGLHPKKEGRASLPDFNHLRRAPDAVLVSHGHHDHCASLPYFLKMFPSTTPFATDGTVAILERMLSNSVSVMEKMRIERGIEDYPLYSRDDVAAAVRKLGRGIPMGREFSVRPGKDVTVCFSPAGHVLGAACTRITTPGHSVLYTGDICVIDQELMPGIKLPPEARDVDTLIIESTYGANDVAHEIEYKNEVARFAEACTRVINREGVVLIPSFALGRTQEVLNMISRLQHRGKIPDVPVYASGLGRAIYEVYQRFHHELKRNVIMTPIENFYSVGDVWDPKVVRALIAEPCIIVATSGMMVENTPSAMIAERLVLDKKHGIFFVGYCDPETLGYKVREAKTGDRLTFRVGGSPQPIVCEDREWFYFSAHAHREDLCKVIDQVNSKNIIFVHGDPPAVEWMMHNAGNGRKKFSPRIGQSIELKA